MAIKVAPKTDLVFGVMAANVTVSHVRFQKADDSEPVIKDVADLAVTAGNRLRIPAANFAVVYPDGELSRAHMMGVVKAYWDGTSIEIDCMTDANTVVSDTGYSQQTHSDWVLTEQADAG